MKPRIFCLSRKPRAAKPAIATPVSADDLMQLRAPGEYLLEPDEAKRRLFLRGISVAEWSRAKGFHKHIVVDLLNGRAKGKYGVAFKAAVALGLKFAPSETC